MPNNQITTNFDGLALPYSTEAEQAVLGAVIIEPDTMSRIEGVLDKPEYFHISLHRVIYSAMLDMFTEGKPLDFVTLIEHLKLDKEFDVSTGKTYLIQLVDNCPSVSNVMFYANIVREKYDVRRLIYAAREIIDDCSAGENEPSWLLDSAEQKIFDIRQGRSVGGLERIDRVIIKTFDRLDALNNKSDSSVKPIPTGIGGLDRIITGLNRTDLLILAARPGMGKTSFALNIAKNVACKSNKTVAFFSLEMPKEQLASRLLSAEASINGTTMRTGQLNEEEWARLVSAGDVLSKANIYLDDTPGITVAGIKAKLRRLRNVDFVVIDYLQLMTSGERGENNRVQEISKITRNLKVMAKEINVPVLTLSQLSRASEKRTENHRPQLSDLRDSGSIEQDADIVLFLYREGYYDKEKGTPDSNADQNSGECLVAKNRHGEANTTVKLHWQGEFMRFTSPDTIHRE